MIQWHHRKKICDAIGSATLQQVVVMCGNYTNLPRDAGLHEAWISWRWCHDPHICQQPHYAARAQANAWLDGARTCLCVRRVLSMTHECLCSLAWKTFLFASELSVLSFLFLVAHRYLLPIGEENNLAEYIGGMDGWFARHM